MRPTIYERLKGIESPRGEFGVHTNDETVDVSASQKGVLLYNSGHPVLGRAVKGEQSVEDSLDELNEGFLGWRNFLPHARNWKHNRDLSELGEVITPPNYLETKGILSKDNLTMSTAYSAVILFPLIFHPALEAYLQNQESFPLAFLLGAGAFGMGVNYERRKAYDDAREQASYIDGKIEELF